MANRTAVIMAAAALLAVTASAQDQDPPLPTIGPVGTYQISAASEGQGGNVAYKVDTRSGQMWICGPLVMVMNPPAAGSGCLELPNTFSAWPKPQ